MLGYHEVEEALKSFTYRPGWKFLLRHNDYEGVDLRIECSVENSYRPSNDVDLGIDSVVPTPMMETADDFYAWLLWRLQCIEAHECQEWFKVDGTAWRDPHEPRDWEPVV
jgi:hypothetical protein